MCGGVFFGRFASHVTEVPECECSPEYYVKSLASVVSVRNDTTSNNECVVYNVNAFDKSIYTPELSLPRVCHRQRADPSELRVELRPLRVELLAYVQDKQPVYRTDQPKTYSSTT